MEQCRRLRWWGHCCPRRWVMSRSEVWHVWRALRSHIEGFTAVTLVAFSIARTMSARIAKLKFQDAEKVLTTVNGSNNNAAGLYLCNKTGTKGSCDRSLCSTWHFKSKRTRSQAWGSFEALIGETPCLGLTSFGLASPRASDQE